MKLRELRTDIEQALSAMYEPGEAQAVTRLLLAQITGQSWHQLSSEFFLNQTMLQTAQNGLEALLRGHPIQHVTGWGHFYGREFKVGSGALIPRGETEELMLWGLEKLLKPPQSGPKKVLDVGTGTGCIPISLQLEWAEKNRPEQLELYALEPYPEAANLARENAALFDVALDIVEEDIFETDVHRFADLNLLISNPPYIPEQERAELAQRVREFEPASALFVPDDDPLLFYRVIAERGLHWLQPGGCLLFECHQDYTEAVAALMQELGYASVSWKRDIHGRPRMAGGEKG
ncbi:MAG: HemK/PrmC family methyltransferase [Bacteroidota bacterium]